MNADSGWTCEALDNAIRRNLEQQGELELEMLEMDNQPFSKRNTRHRQIYSDLIDQLDTLQAEFVRLNGIECMR